MTKLHVDGTALDAVEMGTGDPLVLVHGSASDRRTWDVQLERFARHHRTLAYSRRYHWPNDSIAEGADYSMHEHVDDLEAVIRSWRARPHAADPPSAASRRPGSRGSASATAAPGSAVHLVGHSYGGFVCLLLAARAPELVRTLVLVEPPIITLFVSSPPKPMELLRLARRRPRTAAAIVKFGARGIGPATSAARRGDMARAMQIFGRAVLGGEGHDRLSPTRRQQVQDNAIAAELLGSGLAPIAEADVRRVRAPVLLVNGEKSPALFHRLTDRLEELLPSSERVAMRGASHIVHEDDADDFTEAVLSFLERHAGAMAPGASRRPTG